MKRTTLLCLLALMATLSARAQMAASRYATLLAAKNLMLTTTQGTTYYYLVSSNYSPMLHLTADSVRIGYDTFAKSKIRQMRFHALPRLILDEDSLTWSKTKTLDHGLVALRRELVLGEWNSLVLPIELTGRQICEAFGEDAQVATVRGIAEDDQTVVEFQSLEVTPDAVVMKANYHYLVRPTKEADVSSTTSVTGFATSRIKGPIYLLPNVSMKANQSARYQTIKSADEATQVRFRGTYVALDGSTRTTNKLLAPGVYTLDDESHQFQLREDSTALLAFRSWIQDISAEPRPLRFYIDGVEMTDGIADVSVTDNVNANNAIFDLSGRRVATPTRKGIYIINGKKVAIR